jgi:transcriptional regulator with PAS, ATPase and Fis domain
VFHKRSVSSAPIFNPEGELIGGIMMLGIYYGAHPYTLGMVVAAAQAIENELRTQKKLSAVNKTSNDQKTVISSIPDAIITIDNQGYISFMNDHAKEMLHTAHRAEGKRFKDILGDLNHRFFEIIENNETVTDREVRIFYRNASGDYTLTTNLIISQDGGITGKILFLNEIKRAKSLVATMIGAKAKFHFEDIYGQHPEFLKTIEQARMISQSSSNVLLLGKSGTGKDIFAQAIHNAGDHRDGPYVAINCAAIPRDLISSELFGYSEGAFTGSRKGGNQGKFELADGGTIFLDEIAEIPLELQTVLLRVIEEKTVTRIGGTSVRPINVRIIAATNKDLKEEIKKGAFREDLYYRLNVFSIHLMPLSDRLDDILLLVNHFVRKHEKTMRKRIDRIDNDVISIFMNYSWPGNVRELQNIIERMMSMANGNELTVDLIPQEINDFKNYTKTIESIESPEEKERKMIETMIKMKFQKKAIAKKLNISRMTLYRKIEKYSLT